MIDQTEERLGSFTMTELKSKMHYLRRFAEEKNPIWPFAAMILDEDGKKLVTTVDCTHISPLYHAEALAIHVLVTALGKREIGDLTMFATAEPDPLSFGSLYWSSIVQEVVIRDMYYAVSREELQELWPFGIDISAKEIWERGSIKRIARVAHLPDDYCLSLFKEAKTRQEGIHSDRPADATLSYHLKDFYVIGE